MAKIFLKSARKLPKEQKEKLAELLEVFQNEPFNPILHCKALTKELLGFYSFRITRDWRVIFRFITPFEIQLIKRVSGKSVFYCSCQNSAAKNSLLVALYSI